MRPRKSQTWTRREVFRPPGAASVPRQCSPVAHPLHITGLATGLACRTGFLRHCGTTQESNRGQARRPTASCSIPNPQAPRRAAARRKSPVRLRTSRAEAACASARTLERHLAPRWRCFHCFATCQLLGVIHGEPSSSVEGKLSLVLRIGKSSPPRCSPAQRGILATRTGQCGRIHCGVE